MSSWQPADDATKEGSRRIVVMGAGGTGKSTFSLSASSFAGDKVGAVTATCKDVALIQGDNDGLQGPMDAGLTPGMVADFSSIDKWVDYKRGFEAAIQDLKASVDRGEVKYLIVDLALPCTLIIDHIKPADQQGWGRVKSEALSFYKCLSYLKGATIIGNSQIKSAQAPVETDVARAAAEAKASGGERATFSADLVSSFYAPWSANASFVISREAKKKRNPMKPNEPPVIERFSHMHSSSRFETKCRFQTKVLPTEPGDRTLHSILKTCYGENL